MQFILKYLYAQIQWLYKYSPINSNIKFLLRPSRCVVIAVLLVVSTSVSIISISIGSFSSSPQVLWAQQPPSQSNVSSFEEQHLTNGNSFEIDNTTFSLIRLR